MHSYHLVFPANCEESREQVCPLPSPISEKLAGTHNAALAQIDKIILDRSALHHTAMFSGMIV
jgi:hypothetical protein